MNKNKSTVSKRINNEENTLLISKDYIARQHERRQKLQNVLLIWLDRNINENTKDCQNTVHELQCVVNDVNTFTDMNMNPIELLATSIGKLKYC